LRRPDRSHDAAQSQDVHFRDLIESTLNMLDEGFDKTDADGLQIRARVDEFGLLSFYRAQDRDAPVWSVAFGALRRDQLVFRHGSVMAKDDPPPLLTLDPGQDPAAKSGASQSSRPDARQALDAIDAGAKLGINTAAPRTRLDVGGTIRAEGRLGREPEQTLYANGHWQPITGRLTGCQALEVTAGVGYRDHGRFALLHAVALNTYNPGWLSDLFNRKKPIRQQQACYKERCDRLQLRWCPIKDQDGCYELQIRSHCDYLARERAKGAIGAEKEVRIRVFLTQLWFDEAMVDSS
jgi:hypothetical protein